MIWYSVLVADNWLLIVSGVILVSWITWLIQVLSGVNLFNKHSINADTTLRVAVVNTMICLPIAIYRYLRTHGVLYYGVDTPFRVMSVGLAKAQFQDVRIEYEVCGKLYRKRLTVTRDQVNGNFILIVNPNKPKHIVIKDIS